MSQRTSSILTNFALMLAGMFGLAATAGAYAPASPDSSSSQENIVQIALADPDLSTLVTALTDADLVTTLEGKGPFIVFAPTNEAFAKLPKGILDYLIANPAVLKQVLLYHVVSSGSAVSPTPLFTVQGERVFPSFSYDSRGLTLTVNDSTVTVTPIKASNGEIYVINGVLLPQFR